MRLHFIRRVKMAVVSMSIITAMVSAGAFAQENTNASGITVAGEGKATGKPSVVEIGATVSGQAELAADAIVKYRDTKRRATTALDGLKNSSISVESKGFAVGNYMDASQQQMMMQGRTDVQAKQKVQVSESLTIVIKDADKVAPEALMELVLKVIDTGKDAGLQVGPVAQQNYYQMQMAMQNGQGLQLVSFKIPDATALREQAYRKAVEDAKSKAQRLADMSGVKLGRIISVSDTAAPAMPINYNYYPYNMGMNGNGNGNGDLKSNMFGEITQFARLTVQFEIAK